MCSRLNCRFVHLTEDDKVEVIDQRVAVCRDHANSQCRRKQCKYYHIPIVLPPANIMAAMITNPSEQQAAAAASGVYNSNNNNLIIIEPHQQQQQQQQQQQFAYHTNNNNYYHINNNKAVATHATNMYQHHQHHQQQQQPPPHMSQMTATYHCSSPYSPSSASSSSSCSIATSPTLSSATTLSTTSTATIPTAQQQYAAGAATFLKATPAGAATMAVAPANTTTYYDATPTLVLSSDYNSNCIPILTAAQPGQTSFISLPATQQHVLKFSPQPQHQQHSYHQAHHGYATQVGTVVATTVAGLPATTITMTPATMAASSTCI